jgi:hypothetical protein
MLATISPQETARSSVIHPEMVSSAGELSDVIVVIRPLPSGHTIVPNTKNVTRSRRRDPNRSTCPVAAPRLLPDHVTARRQENNGLNHGVNYGANHGA